MIIHWKHMKFFNNTNTTNTPDYPTALMKLSEDIGTRNPVDLEMLVVKDKGGKQVSVAKQHKMVCTVMPFYRENRMPFKWRLKAAARVFKLTMAG